MHMGAGESQPDIWEEMRQEWVDDKRDEELQRVLGEPRCPCVGPAAVPNLNHQVWNDPARELDEEDVLPMLDGESSDDELMADTSGQRLDDQVRPPDYDTDEELGFEQLNYDWYDNRRGLCRGEAEGVLGAECNRWGPVAWALNTGDAGMAWIL